MFAAFRRSLLPLVVALVFAYAAGIAPASAQSPGLAAPPSAADSPINPEDPEVKSGTPGKDVIFLPTPQEVVSAMLDLAKVTDEDVSMTSVRAMAARQLPQQRNTARAVSGVEFNPKLVALSRQNAEKAGVADRVRFINADLFQTDISEATVVTLYLLSSLNQSCCRSCSTS